MPPLMILLILILNLALVKQVIGTNLNASFFTPTLNKVNR